MNDGWHGLPESSRANRGLTGYSIIHGQSSQGVGQTVPSGYPLIHIELLVAPFCLRGCLINI